MNTILIILGSVTALLILLFLAALILSWIDLIFMRHQERGEQAQFERERRRLKEASHWFSEDPKTMRLISDLAEDCDIGAVREAWRNNKP